MPLKVFIFLTNWFEKCVFLSHFLKKAEKALFKIVISSSSQKNNKKTFKMKINIKHLLWQLQIGFLINNTIFLHLIQLVTGYGKGWWKVRIIFIRIILNVPVLNRLNLSFGIFICLNFIISFLSKHKKFYLGFIVQSFFIMK